MLFKHTTLCKIEYTIYSIPNTLLLKTKGVKTVGIVYSGGCIAAYRAKGSTISIGRNCRFMNWSLGNLIGINHRCILSTYSKEAKLIIGDRCSVMVLKGVTIGRNSLIGAGSVVTKSIPANVIAAGNPCKVIRPVDNETIKKLEEQL